MAKSRIAPFLSISLLILCCLFPLPHIAAVLQDSVIRSFPAFTALRSAPDSQNSTRNPEQIPLAGKISLTGHSLYPITPEAMSHTPAEAKNAVDEALNPYFQAGLLDPGWDRSNCTVTSYIAYGINNNSCTLWEATLTLTKGEACHYLHLYMDDASGRILTIDCQTDFPAAYPEERRSALVTELAQLYLSALDPEFIEEIQYTHREPWAPDAVLLRGTLHDSLYSNVLIDFCVYESGFYVSSPTS